LESHLNDSKIHVHWTDFVVLIWRDYLYYIFYSADIWNFSCIIIVTCHQYCILVKLPQQTISTLSIKYILKTMDYYFKAMLHTMFSTAYFLTNWGHKLTISIFDSLWKENLKQWWPTLPHISKKDNGTNGPWYIYLDIKVIQLFSYLYQTVFFLNYLQLALHANRNMHFIER
jgi:hypothetical protein